MEETIAARSVAYDLARLIEGATQVPCSVFGQVITNHCDEVVGHSRFGRKKRSDAR
jgi:hypothetical protein